jgi:hypothetical protein
MTRNWIVAAVAALALVIPSLAGAHAGHMHKAMGTVTSVQGPHVELKGTDGKTKTIMLDKSTTITRGSDKVDASALKVGDRISVDYMEEKGMLMAHAVKLGAATRTK